MPIRKYKQTNSPSLFLAQLWICHIHAWVFTFIFPPPPTVLMPRSECGKSKVKANQGKRRKRGRKPYLLLLSILTWILILPDLQSRTSFFLNGGGWARGGRRKFPPIIIAHSFPPYGARKFKNVFKKEEGLVLREFGDTWQRGRGGEILTVVRRMSDRKEGDPGVKGKGGFSSSSSPSREKKGKFENIHLSSFISDRPPKGKEGEEEESDGN